eukprot:TRINITY_DN20150_c0_g1_i1.p1 TRINITY_DN20150_c0_g1~~TRINITY_DN20150_c0_g1_i1.p1  ORF type:complete len:1139 (+),score=318.27 TRINITY_DN20150_c0_g1_i1:42-3458(+)
MKGQLEVKVTDVKNVITKYPDALFVIKIGYHFHWSPKKILSKITEKTDIEAFSVQVTDPKLALINIMVYNKDISSKEIIGAVEAPLGRLMKNKSNTMELSFRNPESKKIKGYIILTLEPIGWGFDDAIRSPPKRQLTIIRSDATESEIVSLKEVHLTELYQLDNEVTVVDPFSSDNLMEKEDLSIDFESHYKTAYLCLLLSCFSPVNIVSPPQLARPLYEVAREMDTFAKLLKISNEDHKTIFSNQLATFSKYGADFLKHRRSNLMARPENFDKQENYIARKDFEIKLIDSLLDNARMAPKATKSLFIRIVEADLDIKDKKAPVDVYCGCIIADGKKLLKQKSRSLKDPGSKPSWNEDLFFDISTFSIPQTKLTYYIKNKINRFTYGKITINLSDLIQQQQQTFNQPVFGWSDFKANTETKICMGIHFTERVTAWNEDTQESAQAIRDIGVLEVEKVYQILVGKCGLGVMENPHKWILKDFTSRFGLHPVYQKLLQLEDAFSHLRADADVGNLVYLLDVYDKMDRSTWSNRELELYETIAFKVTKQIKHMFVHFVFFFSKFSTKEIKALLHCLSIIKKDETDSSLVEYFRFGTERSYEIFRKAATSKEKSETLTLILTCKSVENLILHKIEQIDKLAVIFEDHPNPVDVSIQMYDTLLYQEMTALLLEDPTPRSPVPGHSEEEPTKEPPDPSEVILLYQVYESLTKIFKQKATKHVLYPYTDLYEPWISKWLLTVNVQLETWIEKAITTDSWQSVSSSVLFSASVVTLQQCIRANLEIITNVRKNKESIMRKYSIVGSNIILYFSSKMMNIITTRLSSPNNFKWEGVGISCGDFLRDYTNESLIYVSLTQEVGVQINSLFASSKVLKDFEESIKEFTTEEIHEKIMEEIFQPTYTKLKEDQNSTISTIANMMRSDIRNALEWLVDARAGEDRDEPLFAYLNNQLEILNKKLEFIHFRYFLKDIFTVLIDEITVMLDNIDIQPNLFSSVLSKKQRLRTQDAATALYQLVESLNSWIQGNGDGLSEMVTQKIIRLLQLRLNFWSAPTTTLLLTHSNYDELTFEISKEEISKIIESRDQDPEAVHYANTQIISNLSLSDRLARSISTTSTTLSTSQSTLPSNTPTDSTLPNAILNFFGWKK